MPAALDLTPAPEVEPVAGELFVDQDGDICINDGRENNLVFCTAMDDDGKPLCPDVAAEAVRRFNARALTAQDAARVPEIAELIEDIALIAKSRAADAPEWTDNNVVTVQITIGTLRAAIRKREEDPFIGL